MYRRPNDSNRQQPAPVSDWSASLNTLLQPTIDRLKLELQYTRAIKIEPEDPLVHYMQMQQFNDAMANVVDKLKRSLVERKATVRNIGSTAELLIETLYGGQDLFSPQDIKKMMPGIFGRIQKVGKDLAALPDQETRSEFTQRLAAVIMEVENQRILRGVSFSSPISLTFRALNQSLESQPGLADRDKAGMLWSLISKQISSIDIREIRDIAEILSSHYRSDRDQPQDDYAAKFIEQVALVKAHSPRDAELISNLLSDRLLTSRKPTRFNKIFDESLENRFGITITDINDSGLIPIDSDDEKDASKPASSSLRQIEQTELDDSGDEWQVEEVGGDIGDEWRVEEFGGDIEEEEAKHSASSTTSQIQLSFQHTNEKDDDLEAFGDLMDGTHTDEIHAADSYNPSAMIQAIRDEAEEAQALQISHTTQASTAPKLGIKSDGE